MALGSHRKLIVDFGDGITEELYFDNEIQKYRGQAVGIWSMELLIEIAKGEVDSTTLRVI